MSDVSEEIADALATQLEQSEAELKAGRERIEVLEGQMHSISVHWRGKCGHDWRKDQSDDCPICARDKALADVERLKRMRLENRKAANLVIEACEQSPPEPGSLMDQAQSALWAALKETSGEQGET